jgi:hypothetical protein
MKIRGNKSRAKNTSHQEAMEWLRKDRIDHAVVELPNGALYTDFVQGAELFCTLDQAPWWVLH